MLACLDVHYTGDHAHAAAVTFESWHSTSSLSQFTAALRQDAPYEPGNFFRRELPPLLAVLGRLPEEPQTILIDGYCVLSAEGEPGLGAHLSEKVSPDTTIVGIAKNRYRDSTHAAEVLRGTSKQPLFITAINMPQQVAAKHVHDMAGTHRIPMMIKAVDTLARAEAI